MMEETRWERFLQLLDGHFRRFALMRVRFTSNLVLISPHLRFSRHFDEARLLTVSVRAETLFTEVSLISYNRQRRIKKHLA